MVIILDPTPDDRALDAEFETFFLAHHDEVLRSLDGMLADHEAAVDATQDAFIRAHARWSTIRTYEAPQAWVRRIAINASRDRMRSERRRRDREVTAHATAEPSPTDRLVADAGVQELLDGLAPRRARGGRALLREGSKRGRDCRAARAESRHGQVAVVGGASSSAARSRRLRPLGRPDIANHSEWSLDDAPQ